MNQLETKRRATLFLQKGRFDEAIAEYQALLENSRKTHPATLNIIGDIYIKKGAYEQGFQYFLRASKAYCDEGLFHNGIAVAKKILRLDREQIEVYGSLGILYARQGLGMDCVKFLTEYARLKAARGETPAALAAFAEACEIMPDAPEIHISYADGLEREGRIDDAVACYERAAELYSERGLESFALEMKRKAEQTLAGNDLGLTGEESAGGMSDLMTLRDLDGPAGSSGEFALEDLARRVSRAPAEPESSASAPSQENPTVSEEIVIAEPPAEEPTESGSEPDVLEITSAAFEDPALNEPRSVESALESRPVELSTERPSVPDVPLAPALEDATVPELTDLFEEDPLIVFDPALNPDLPPPPPLPPRQPTPVAPKRDLTGGEAFGAPPVPSVPAEPSSRAASEEIARESAGVAEEAAASGDSLQELPGIIMPPSHAAGQASAPPRHPPPPPLPPRPDASEEAPKKEDRAVVVGDDFELVREGGDVAEVIAEFREATSHLLDLDDFQAHYDLGTTYLEMDLFDEAAGEFEIAARGRELALAAREMMGYCFLRQGKIELAITELKKGLEVPGREDRDKLGLMYNLGIACGVLDMESEAIRHFQKILEIDEHFRDTRSRLERLVG